MKRPKPPARRPKPPKKFAIIGMKLPAPTRKQLDELTKLFKAKAVATLGISPSAMTTTRQYSTARKRRR